MEWINIDMQDESEDIDEMLFHSALALIEQNRNDLYMVHLELFIIFPEEQLNSL